MTSSPYEPLLFGVVFCSFAMIVCAVRAHREKDKMYYIGTIASFLMLLVCVFLIFNQRLLAIILFAFAGIFAIVTLPISLKFLERKSVELAQVNLSAPLRGRELLTYKGILKLAYRWGVWTIVFLYWLLEVVILGGILYTLSIWAKSLSTTYIVSYTFTFSTFSTIMIYRQIKAFNVNKKSLNSTSPTTTASEPSSSKSPKNTLIQQTMARSN